MMPGITPGLDRVVSTTQHAVDNQAMPGSSLGRQIQKIGVLPQSILPLPRDPQMPVNQRASNHVNRLSVMQETPVVQKVDQRFRFFTFVNTKNPGIFNSDSAIRLLDRAVNQCDDLALTWVAMHVFDGLPKYDNGRFESNCIQVQDAEALKNQLVSWVSTGGFDLNQLCIVTESILPKPLDQQTPAVPAHDRNFIFFTFVNRMTDRHFESDEKLELLNDAVNGCNDKALSEVTKKVFDALPKYDNEDFDSNCIQVENAGALKNQLVSWLSKGMFDLNQLRR